jgi:hypothetical protein
VGDLGAVAVRHQGSALLTIFSDAPGPLANREEGSVMEQTTTRMGIEPGRGLIGRFGDTVILIPRRRRSRPKALTRPLGSSSA